MTDEEILEKYSDDDKINIELDGELWLVKDLVSGKTYRGKNLQELLSNRNLDNLKSRVEEMIWI